VVKYYLKGQCKMETLSGNDPRHYNDIKDSPMERVIFRNYP
jgi:hypothetical protein